MKKISIVILNWNGCEILRSFLPSVIHYSDGDDIEICVADNGSTDTSVAMLREEFPAVRLILLEQNHGFAEGYNLALNKVDAEYGCGGNGTLARTTCCLYGYSSRSGGLPAENSQLASKADV